MRLSVLFEVGAYVTSDKLLQIWVFFIYDSGVALRNCGGRQIAQKCQFLHDVSLNASKLANRDKNECNHDAGLCAASFQVNLCSW